MVGKEEEEGEEKKEVKETEALEEGEGGLLEPVGEEGG